MHAMIRRPEGARPQPDQEDERILAERVALLDKQAEPRVGDYVIFADGVTRRISYVWRFDSEDPAEHEVQTSDGGSWYLGTGFCDFSGGLHSPVKAKTLTDTGEKREGEVWFFHHDWSTGHNGVYARVDFRVYRCNLNAP
jgi:hypothetical protein